jgi:hypothetical protein
MTEEETRQYIEEQLGKAVDLSQEAHGVIMDRVQELAKEVSGREGAIPASLAASAFVDALIQTAVVVGVRLGMPLEALELCIKTQWALVSAAEEREKQLEERMSEAN